jgi:hypothetical protein
MNVCRQCSPGANGVPCPAGYTCTMNTCVAVPEAGPPDSGREGGAEAGSEGGADTRTDTPVSTDAPADVSTGG